MLKQDEKEKVQKAWQYAEQKGIDLSKNYVKVGGLKVYADRVIYDYSKMFGAGATVEKPYSPSDVLIA